MFSKKATKIDEIFIVDLILCSSCQIDGEDFVNSCGLLGKYELYTYYGYPYSILRYQRSESDNMIEISARWPLRTPPVTVIGGLRPNAQW